LHLWSARHWKQAMIGPGHLLWKKTMTSLLEKTVVTACGRMQEHLLDTSQWKDLRPADNSSPTAPDYGISELRSYPRSCDKCPMNAGLGTAQSNSYT
jgi:hypothetical protein